MTISGYNKAASKEAVSETDLKPLLSYYGCGETSYFDGCGGAYQK